MNSELRNRVTVAHLDIPAAGKSKNFTPPIIAVQAKRLFRWARCHSSMRILPVVERELIVLALKETHGNQTRAAVLLGITRATMRKRIQRFGIQMDLTIE